MPFNLLAEKTVTALKRQVVSLQDTIDYLRTVITPEEMVSLEAELAEVKTLCAELEALQIECAAPLP